MSFSGEHHRSPNKKVINYDATKSSRSLGDLFYAHAHEIIATFPLIAGTRSASGCGIGEGCVHSY